METIFQDLRYALRTIRRAPGFAVIAVGSSALGIGACAVIFAVLNVALFTPLPVDEPGRLMSLSGANRRTGQTGDDLSYPDFRDLRQARAFDGVAAWTSIPASIASHGEPQRHWGIVATANYFDVVRPRFALGRGFEPARDDTPGAPRVLVLSHEFWRRSFAGDPAIAGRTVSFNTQQATVIGVTAAGFRGTEVGFVPEFWIPFSMIEEHRVFAGIIGRVMENRQRYWLTAIARLRNDLELPAARAELDVIARRMNAGSVRGDADRGFHLERAGQLAPQFRVMALTSFSVAVGATVLVLLVACANVANLLLGRAWARRGEIAARMALGASRPRLLRQLLTESLLIALAGGIGGWIVALWGTSLLDVVQTPFGWPLDLSISPDYRVLLFCVALSVLTAIAFGLVPALRATRVDLVTDLKAGARGSAAAGRFGLRSGLVVAQVAVSALLLVFMGLFLRSLQAAQRTDLGLSNRNLLLMAFDPGLDRRPDPQARQLLRAILDRAGRIAGVESATLTTAVPLTFIVSNSRFVPAENAKNPQADRVRADIYSVGPAFFETMGVPFMAGEDFRVVDRAGAGIPAIVNEAFARAAFPGQSPLGRRVLGDGKALEIVGLVGTVKSRTVGETPRPTIYLPILSHYAAAESPRGVTLVVKTRDAAAAYTDVLREALRGADSSLAIFDVRTMESHVSDALIVSRIILGVSVAAGCVGLVIAIVGIYGVVSFAVARRRREFGIRLAIGARPRAILMMILREGSILALIGTGVGMAAALGLTRLGATLLYGVSATDGLTFGVVAPLLLLVALLACVVPARLAARVNPIEVLRSE